MKIELSNNQLVKVWQEIQMKGSAEHKPFVFLSTDGITTKLGFHFEGNDFYTKYSSLVESDAYVAQFGRFFVAEDL